MYAKVFHKRTIKKGILLFLVAMVGLALLKWPDAVSGGIDRGMSICTTVIIPSLFPFLVLTSIISLTGLDQSLGHRLDRVTRCVFRLPGCCAPAILIGMIGGYPAGSVAIAGLLRKGAISQAQAKRMLLFCVNAGPAFILSTVGAALMGNISFGVIILVGHSISALLIGISTRWMIHTKEENMMVTDCKETMSSGALALAVNSACRTLLYMCGFVVLFAGLQALGDASGVSERLTRLFAMPVTAIGGESSDAGNILPILIEVTGGCVAAVGGENRLFWLGFALGWGGLSVHCQLLSTLQEFRLIDRRFFAARLSHGVLGGLCNVILCRFIPVTQPTLQTLSGISVDPSATSLPTALTLLLMCVLLLFTNGQFAYKNNF